MLDLQKISFSYSEKPFIKNLSLRIARGEHISIIGASGCGKSTLLQLIYGLHHVKGKIFWEGKQLLGPNFNLVPGEDFIKYLTQDFDLMPSISVAENIGKYLSNIYPRKKQKRIRELLELVEMKELANTKAKYLSGGQQQRVALARVLANEPEVLLLDEPFSHIDHFRKNKLRRNLFTYLREKNITCLIATHDSTDALSFADRTLVMREGKILAQGSPQELYRSPKNLYVASLFGEVNELPVSFFRPEETSGKKLIIYPHELIPAPKTNGFPAKVKTSWFKGSNYLVEAETQGGTVFFENPTAPEKGMELQLQVLEGVLELRG